MSEKLARDIMISDVKVAKKDETIEIIAKKLLDDKIGGLPVVDENNKVIGIISETDILKKQKSIETPQFINFLEGIIFIDNLKDLESDLKKVAAYKVEDLMSKEIVTVNLDDTFDTVANVMIKNSVNRVPVVDDEGVLHGIIARYDIIKSLYKD